MKKSLNPHYAKFICFKKNFNKNAILVYDFVLTCFFCQYGHQSFKLDVRLSGKKIFIGRSNPPSLNRSQHGCAVYKDELYVAGGFFR